MATHHKLYLATQSSFILVKPLKVVEYDEIYQSAIEAQELFLANKKHSQLDESVCGWSAHRSIANRVVSYALKKTYFHISADFLSPVLWRLFAVPELMRSIFVPSLEMQVRVVQQVDSDNIVMLQEYVETGVNGERINVKTLHLLARRRTGRGYLQVIHSLGSDRLEFFSHPQPGSGSDRIVWNDQYAWYEAQDSQLLPGRVPMLWGCESIQLFCVAADVWSTGCDWNTAGPSASTPSFIHSGALQSSATTLNCGWNSSLRYCSDGTHSPSVRGSRCQSKSR